MNIKFGIKIKNQTKKPPLQDLKHKHFDYSYKSI